MALAVGCLGTALWLVYRPGAEEAGTWALVIWFVSPWLPEKASRWTFDLAAMGAFLLAQWIFLCPRRHWRLRMSERGRPMRAAVIVGAGMAMLLSYALIATMSEIFLAESWVDFLNDSEENRSRLDIYGIMIALWLFWTYVFWRYRRPGDGLSTIGRIATALIAGSVLELIIAVGVYAWDPQREKCACARGSFTGIVFGATVMIWAFGPALIVLFLRGKQLRR